MDTINERIAQCINASGLTKTAFAQKIGLTQAYVSALSIGRKLPSDRTIADICREFHISETWLRTGEGEMSSNSPETLSDRLARDYGLDDLGRQIMAAYLKLDEGDRLSVGKLIQSLMDERTSNQKPAPAAPIVPPGYSSREELEREADEFAALAREQFLSEKRRETQTSSANESGAG